MPWSATESNALVVVCPTTIAIGFLSPYLMALVSKLVITCSIRMRSHEPLI